MIGFDFITTSKHAYKSQGQAIGPGGNGRHYEAAVRGLSRGAPRLSFPLPSRLGPGDLRSPGGVLAVRGGPEVRGQKESSVSSEAPSDSIRPGAVGVATAPSVSGGGLTL